jgi:hypothetical protein
MQRTRSQPCWAAARARVWTSTALVTAPRQRTDGAGGFFGGGFARSMDARSGSRSGLDTRPVGFTRDMAGFNNIADPPFPTFEIGDCPFGAHPAPQHVDHEYLETS